MLRLELENGPSIDLDAMRDEDGSVLCHITELDLGYPDVREVSEPRVDANGTVDRTRWYGARTVQLTGKVAVDWDGRGRRQRLMRALAPFLVPSARPWLISTFDDGTTKRIRLRPDDFSRPQIANIQDISLSFKASDALEALDASTVQLVPEVAIAGRTYWTQGTTVNVAPGVGSQWRIYDRVYPLGSGTDVLVVNRGSVPADWTARMFGPCHGPGVVNVDTGERVVLKASYNVTAGDYVQVATRDHTVRANGDPDASRWAQVNYTATEWWQLPPGETRIRYYTDSWNPGAVMFFSWRDAFLI